MNKVLLIDDDIELVDMLKEYLENEGFEAKVAYDGDTGMEYALVETFSIIVLDVMMPRRNGIETLRSIRKHTNTPVLMLTAKGDEADRFFGLEMGADDYVPKPCTSRELVARIRAILRRTQADPAVQIDEPTEISSGPLYLWPAKRMAAWDGKPLELTSTEFNLLEVLVRQAGHVVSKKKLSEEGLGRPLSRFDRSIDVHLSSIRHKLGNFPDGRHCLQTVYRMGYQLLKD